MTAVDVYGRFLTDLRISVTDRCNFRCSYCMPRAAFPPDYPFLPRGEILSYEELARLARIFASLGVSKIRITGGEPLLRRDLGALIEQLAVIPGVTDLCLTTNGVLLGSMAASLRSAGLSRVTVSLDALDDQIFRRMTDGRTDVGIVLDAIERACDAGFESVKVNTVVQKGVNEDQIVRLADYFRDTPVILRFIEYMDVGSTNGWRPEDVVSEREILEVLRSRWEIEQLPHDGGVATRFRYADGAGELGIISSVSRPFCGSCTRARVSAEGKLYTCLFSSSGHDLRQLLRTESDDESIRARIVSIWSDRTDRYSEQRTTESTSPSRVEMSHIGG